MLVLTLGSIAFVALLAARFERELARLEEEATPKA
jgi:hypothetical protein